MQCALNEYQLGTNDDVSPFDWCSFILNSKSTNHMMTHMKCIPKISTHIFIEL